MKRLGQLFKIITICMVILFIPSVLISCKKDSDKKASEYYLYYLNKEQTKLEAVNYNIKEKDTDDMIEELLNAMNKSSGEINNIIALPSEVSIINSEIEDNVLYIDFSNHYNDMDRTREILCRSAIVLTMTQIEDVKYVNFTINGEPLSDTSGRPVGNMKETDFVDSSGSTINSYEDIEVTIYYADKTGKKLVPKMVEGIHSTNTSIEKFVIEQLQKGVDDENLRRTIPANVKLNSVSTKEGVCYVNFDSTFLTETIGVSDEVEIYSVVNSLCELTYVNKVQISINGETNKTLHGKISLENFFVRNLDIVEGVKTEKKEEN